MNPALDEVQQTVNKAAQMVISVSKGVAKWSEERKRATKAGQERETAAERRQSVVSAASEAAGGEKKEEEPAPTNYTITHQTKNYFKAVSENKDVTKLVSLLSTAINSTKKVGGSIYS